MLKLHNLKMRMMKMKFLNYHKKKSKKEQKENQYQLKYMVFTIRKENFNQKYFQKMIMKNKKSDNYYQKYSCLIVLKNKTLILLLMLCIWNNINLVMKSSNKVMMVLNFTWFSKVNYHVLKTLVKKKNFWKNINQVKFLEN